MPETFILYRFFFKWLEGKNPASTANWRNHWNQCMRAINEQQKEAVLDVIHKNVFTDEIQHQFNNPIISDLLDFYTNYRKDIITSGTESYQLKQEYDANPTKELRRKKKEKSSDN